jgi:NADH:ubiquinone oxidoreductase subunit 6 (subunit J)
MDVSLFLLFALVLVSASVLPVTARLPLYAMVAFRIQPQD